MFSIFFFQFFLKKKVSSFLFSCISFKYVLLLALVSESNCFLSSRCSMEMWCPDDTGPWERACFNSPEWGGGSSPVKKEPPQIVVVVVSDAYESVCMCTAPLPCHSDKLIKQSCKPGDVGLHKDSGNYLTPVLI